MATIVADPHEKRDPERVLFEIDESDFEDRSPGTGGSGPTKFKVKRDGEWVPIS